MPGKRWKTCLPERVAKTSAGSGKGGMTVGEEGSSDAFCNGEITIDYLNK